MDQWQKERDADATAQDANATAIATAVGAAFQQFRDDDLPDIVAVAIAAATPEPAAGDTPPADTPPVDGEPPPDDDGGRAANFDAEVQARADLIVQVQPLMPKDYAFAGKTRSEILVTAAGDEVPNAAERSRRLPARQGGRHPGTAGERAGPTAELAQPAGVDANSNVGDLSAPVSSHSVVTARNAAKMRAATDEKR